MSDELVRNLASRAGVSITWRDQSGEERLVSIGTLRSVLNSLGFPAADEGEVRNSLSALDVGMHLQTATARFVTARVNQPVALPWPGQPGESVEISYDSGATRVVSSIEGFEGALALPPFETPGYHRVHLPSGDFIVATAPARCISYLDLSEGRQGWGLAAQVYSLRTDGDCGSGDFGAVAQLARASAGLGADLLAISPVHALFGAEPRHYSPYSPSTRLFYNPVYADPGSTLPDWLVKEAGNAAGVAEAIAAAQSDHLVDWPSAHKAKMTLLSTAYRLLQNSNEQMRGAFENFRSNASPLLKDHALFEALHDMHLKLSEPLWDWRRWDEGYRKPDGAAAVAFAKEHPEQIDFQIFLQWLTGRSYGEAHKHAKESGMKVGLVADLAIGMAPSGSHAWSRQNEVLHGLSIGAPPDYYSADGQAWGLTTFSPRGLAASGFSPFIDTLRACLRHAGGLRIDHIMGMSRLWLVPDGASAIDGAYVSFPSETLFRLIALESWRHHAIVIGEDLGTLPTGFPEYLQEQGVAGMSVLRFERRGTFYKQPGEWRATSAGMTSTHDMIATAGWWKGADIDAGPKQNQESEIRDWDRGLMWSAFETAGVAQGDRPPPEQPTAAVDAAISYVAKTSCAMKIIALEDLVASDVQLNTPGTTTEKPNWRHRYDATSDTLLAKPEVRERAARLGQPRVA